MKRFVVAIITVFSLALAGRNLCADFSDLGAGGRALGLGNSYTALADDVFGLYYNPAGLGFLRTAQMGADFGKLHAGLDDDSNLLAGFSAVAYPLLKATVSETRVSLSSATASEASTSTVSGIALSTGTIRTTSYRHNGTFAVGWRYFSLVDAYQESAYYLSFGHPIANRWAWGINLKLLQEKYILNDYLKASPVFDYGKKDAVQSASADVGIMYNIAPRFFAGLSIADVNQPDLGLRDKDQLPYTGRFGVAWKEKGMTWVADIVTRQNQWYYSTGFEKYLTNIFGVRCGLGLGGHNYFNIAGGFSVNLYRIELDYVFQYPLSVLKDISGTHRMSLLFRFGRREKGDMEVGSIEYYYSKLQDELEDVNSRLEETEKEKANLEKVLIEEATIRIREKIKEAKTEARTVPSAPSPSVRLATEAKTTREIRHLVRPGDTLQTLAEKYYGASKFWDEIYQANKDNIGRGGALRPNQLLIIPSLSSRSGSSGAETTAVPRPAPSTPAAPAPSGETRSSAGSAVPVKTSPAATRSNLQTRAVESVMPIVVVPPPSSAASASPSIVEEPIRDNALPVRIEPAAPARRGSREIERAAPPRPRSSVVHRHIVQPGENLRIIAQKYYNDSAQWKEIYKANKDKISGGQVIPGQEIVIP